MEGGKEEEGKQMGMRRKFINKVGRKRKEAEGRMMIKV